MMMSNIINRLNISLQKIDHFIEFIIRGRFPPQGLCAIEVNHHGENYEPTYKPSPLSLKDIWGEGILWGVPKHRRTIERRMRRRYGFPDQNWKLLSPKTNLIMCNACGHHHEANILCVKCYGRIKEETDQMQKAILEQLEISPVEKEVIVLYEGERTRKTEKFWKNRRIVELPKKRPEWFDKNLLQPTTQEPSDSKEVKPTDLV